MKILLLLLALSTAASAQTLEATLADLKAKLVTGVGTKVDVQSADTYKTVAIIPIKFDSCSLVWQQKIASYVNNQIVDTYVTEHSLPAGQIDTAKIALSENSQFPGRFNVQLFAHGRKNSFGYQVVNQDNTRGKLEEKWLNFVVAKDRTSAETLAKAFTAAAGVCSK